MNFIQHYLNSVQAVCAAINKTAIEQCVDILAATKAANGRLFILGLGGSAANASHAVNDFRKICRMEAYAPTDNVAELTARANDDGWETIFSEWLNGSNITAKDCVLVLSVGGGNLQANVSTNLVRAIDFALLVGASVIGIVGRDGGHTAKHATACVVIPTMDNALITPLAESFQAVIWHLMVNHPKLK